jgi:hypothetical protein
MKLSANLNNMQNLGYLTMLYQNHIYYTVFSCMTARITNYEVKGSTQCIV